MQIIIAICQSTALGDVNLLVYTIPLIISYCLFVVVLKKEVRAIKMMIDWSALALGVMWVFDC